MMIIMVMMMTMIVFTYDYKSTPTISTFYRNTRIFSAKKQTIKSIVIL